MDHIYEVEIKFHDENETENMLFSEKDGEDPDFDDAIFFHGVSKESAIKMIADGNTDFVDFELISVI